MPLLFIQKSQRNFLHMPQNDKNSKKCILEFCAFWNDPFSFLISSNDPSIEFTLQVNHPIGPIGIDPQALYELRVSRVSHLVMISLLVWRIIGTQNESQVLVHSAFGRVYSTQLGSMGLSCRYEIQSITMLLEVLMGQMIPGWGIFSSPRQCHNCLPWARPPHICQYGAHFFRRLGPSPTNNINKQGKRDLIFNIKQF